MSHGLFSMETLEGRALLSATPSAVILADQTAVAHAAQTLVNLQANRQTTLANDRVAIANAWKQNPADIAQLVQRYRTTLAERQVQVAAARAELLAARATWAEVYRNDVAAVQAARGNPVALAEARAKLANDRIEHRRLITGATTNIRDTRLSWRSAVASDARAVQRAQILGGSHVQNARNTYRTHIRQFQSAIVDATQALQFARMQLARDLALGL